MNEWSQSSSMAGYQQAQDALSSPKGAYPVLIAKILKPQNISSPVTIQKLSTTEDSERRFLILSFANKCQEDTTSLTFSLPTYIIC